MFSSMRGFLLLGIGFLIATLTTFFGIIPNICLWIDFLPFIICGWTILIMHLFVKMKLMSFLLGLYNHPSVPKNKMKPVQQEIQYCPHVELICYDIAYNLKDQDGALGKAGKPSLIC